MINLNLNQDNKLTFNVGIVGTKTPPNIVRLCLGNDLVRLSFDASPNGTSSQNNSEWVATIPAIPELSKYFVGPIRIKIEVIVGGKYFVPFDKELSVEGSSSVSFEVSNMTVTSDGVIAVDSEEEEEEEVKQPEEKPEEEKIEKPEEKKETFGVDIMRIIEPKVEEKKKEPVLSKEMLLGEHISGLNKKQEKKPQPTKQSNKKYYIKPLEKKQKKDTSVDITNVAKQVIKEESKRQEVVKEDRNKQQVSVKQPKRESNTFKLIKKNIVEK